MTRHCLPTLLLIVVLTLVGYAQTIDAQITGGKLSFTAPVDPAMSALKEDNTKLAARVTKLEADVKELNRQMAAILKSKVIVGDAVEFGSLINP
jgi:cell division protein FtsB